MIKERFVGDLGPKVIDPLSKVRVSTRRREVSVTKEGTNERCSEYNV